MVPNTNKCKRRWLKPAIVLAIFAAFIAWSIPWVLKRLNTKPLSFKEAFARYQLSLPPAPDPRVSGKLAAVCNALNPLPIINEPPPKGMRWRTNPNGREINILDTLRGEWTPDVRPNLRASIKYITSRPIETSLNSLISCRGQSFRVDDVHDFSILLFGTHSTQPAPDLEGIFQLAETYVARARYRHAQLEDVSGAWDDLKACLWLSNIANNANSAWLHTGLEIESQACTECIHLANEQRIQPEVATEIYKTLSNRLDLLLNWRNTLENEKKAARIFLATCYVDKPDGTGWMVLSEGPMANRGHISAFSANAKRSRLWNLATVFHRDFSSVDKKLCSVYDAAANASMLTFSEGIEQLQSQQAMLKFDDRDGPMKSYGRLRNIKYLYTLMYKTMLYRRAAMVTVALNQYYGQHGRYPETLRLCDVYFDTSLPSNPFTGSPFQYHCRNSGQDYVLRADDSNNGDNEPIYAGENVWSFVKFDYSTIPSDRKNPFHETKPIPLPSPPPVQSKTNGAKP